MFTNHPMPVTEFIMVGRELHLGNWRRKEGRREWLFFSFCYGSPFTTMHHPSPTRPDIPFVSCGTHLTTLETCLVLGDDVNFFFSSRTHGMLIKRTTAVHVDGGKKIRVAKCGSQDIFLSLGHSSLTTGRILPSWLSGREGRRL